jgi:hypothetical protein
MEAATLRRMRATSVWSTTRSLLGLGRFLSRDKPNERSSAFGKGGGDPDLEVFKSRYPAASIRELLSARLTFGLSGDLSLKYNPDR